MASAAYLKLLSRGVMTVNTFARNPFMQGWNGRFHHKPTIEEMTDFIMARLERFKVKGYSEEYIRQLVTENEGAEISFRAGYKQALDEYDIM